MMICIEKEVAQLMSKPILLALEMKCDNHGLEIA